MGRYVARRLLQAIPVFFGATFIVFAMVYLIPGDPIRALNGERPISESAQAVLRDRYNLDDPLVVQYAKYVGGLVTGDFGETFRGRPVFDIMKDKFPVTAKLALAAFIFEGVLGLIAGILAGLRRGSFMDNLVLVSTTAIVAILRSDYIRTAEAKGLPRRRVVGRHALRNSLIPVVTFLGVDLGTLMAGAIITEGIFNVPGVGREVFLAVQGQEYAVVVGIVTAGILIFIVMNLVVDLLYSVLDPRIRYE